MADIYIGSSDRGRVYRLPFIPEELPEISVAARNEEFATYQSGVYNILGNVGLREIPLEGVLPNRSYSFAKSNVRGKEIINLMEKAMKSKKPLRLILSGRTSINLLVSVESLSWNENKAGNIAYSASFKEYRRV